MCCDSISEKIFLHQHNWWCQGGAEVIYDTLRSGKRTAFLFNLFTISLWLFICDFDRRLAASIKKPFELRYNPYTGSVDALTTSGAIKDLAKELRGDMFLISNAMRKLQVYPLKMPTNIRIGTNHQPLWFLFVCLIIS